MLIYRRIGKRCFDVTVAAVVLALAAPLIVAVAVSVRLNLGSPVLFTQIRPGKNGRLFRMVKFRTMTSERGSNGALLPDEERLTRFGKWLRSTSLDELPEVWNVLRGEMSIVGPRPLLPQYLSHYSLEQARRHEIVPGITGLAQVSGRNAITWEERFRLDVLYVDGCSLWLDLKIIGLTCLKVIKRDGVCAEGFATMSAFNESCVTEDRTNRQAA